MGEVKKKPKDHAKVISEILEGYVQNKSGSIFQVLGDNNSKAYVHLRTGNKYYRKPLIEIRQGIADGTYKSINEHQWRKWVKEDNIKLERLSQRILKRTIYTQLLLELDDQLKEDHEGEKNFINHINKTQKVAERLANKMYDRIYEADKENLTNIEKQVDEITSTLSSASIYDLVHLNVLVKDYFKNPEKYQKKEVVFEKID